MTPNAGLVAVALLVIAPVIEARASRDTARIITEVQESRITLDDRSVLRAGPNVRVVKPGYEFELKDLRPGWAIRATILDGLATTIEVVGIPPVRNYLSTGGMKEVVAVGRCEMGMMLTDRALQGVDVQQAIEALMASALEATGRFIIVDLGTRDEVLNEQDFARSGYGNTATASRGGRLLTARFLAKPTIVDFDVQSKTGSAFSVLGVHAGRSRTWLKLGMELRLVDTETGEIVEVVHTSRAFGSRSTQVLVNIAETAGAIAVNAGSRGLGRLEKLASAGINFAHNGFNASPLGELLSLGVDDLVTRLLVERAAKPWQSVIVNVIDAETIIVRGGSDVGMKRGDRFEVMSRTEALLDPETGENLGSLSAPAGVAEVTEVQEKISVAVAREGHSFRRGDVCLLRRSKP